MVRVAGSNPTRDWSVGSSKGKGYEWFLPLLQSRRRWSDRVKEVDAPLFPGYLFCRFNPNDRLPILKTPGVTQIVGYNHVPILLMNRRSQRFAGWLLLVYPIFHAPIWKLGARFALMPAPLGESKAY